MTGDLNSPAMPVYVVGSVNADIALPVDRLPTAGSTILAGQPVRTGGGKGANVAVAAARDGAEVRLVAAIGPDPEGERSRQELHDDDVGLEHLVILNDQPTGLAMICVDGAGENFVVVAPGANAALTCDHVHQGLRDLEADDVAVVNFEIPEEAVLAAGQASMARGARLVVNPSPVRSIPDELLTRATILVANLGELIALTGAREPIEAAAALHRRGCGPVVVTLGERGALVINGEGESVGIDPFPAAPLAASLAAGADLIDAARRGSAAAALSTESVGARTAMPVKASTDRMFA
jgi:ribokinase